MAVSKKLFLNGSLSFSRFAYLSLFEYRIFFRLSTPKKLNPDFKERVVLTEEKKEVMTEDKKWIQKAVKGMRKDKPCTGSKLGSKSCPPGSKRYTLAKTFSKMNKKK